MRAGVEAESGARSSEESSVLLDRGLELGKLGKSEEAIAAYDDLIAQFVKATDDETAETVSQEPAGVMRSEGTEAGRNGAII